VTISPEARVKVKQGPAKAVLAEAVGGSFW